MAEKEIADQSLVGTLAGAIEEGSTRLRRTTPTLAATGLVGGIDLGIGVLAMLAVRHATGSELLGALAFGIGFVALVLAKSELFTENFLVPVMAVVSDKGRWTQLARLWSGTLVANLVGGWVIMAIVVAGAPDLTGQATLGDLGGHFIERGIGLETFASAVLGGASITLFTWMERSTGSVPAKLVAAVATAFVLAAVPLLHSIVTSLEVFGTLIAGAPFGYLDWLGLFAWSVLGNVIGGVGLVTVLRFVQARSVAT